MTAPSVDSGSPIRLRLAQAADQPDVNLALEELYRGFERALLVPLWTEIGDLMPATRSRLLSRIYGGGSNCGRWRDRPASWAPPAAARDAPPARPPTPRPARARCSPPRPLRRTRA